MMVLAEKMLSFMVLGVALFLCETAHARQGYLSLVPHTNSQSCLPCHSNGGGTARTAFGLDFQANGFSWSNLWNLDSDNDGQTNGEELGDPCGTWTVGQSTSREGFISAPEDENSVSSFPLMGATMWFFDGDHDDVGVSSIFIVQCDVPQADYAALSGDCDDSDASVWQETFVFADQDGDGRGAGMEMLVCSGATLPLNTAVNDDDCDDSDPDKYQFLPGFYDLDEDGFGGGELTWVCAGDALPSGVLADKNDCDDDDPTVSQWRYLSVDADNDGVPGERPSLSCVGDNVNEGYWEAEMCGADFSCGNGYSCDVTEILCLPDEMDCDDSDPAIYVMRDAFVDRDEDSYGAGGIQEACLSDPLPLGWSEVGNDCDDEPETGGLAYHQTQLYRDADGDGVTQGDALVMCIGDTPPNGFLTAAQGEDCDDNDDQVFQELFGFPDLDQDGLTGIGRSVCTGSSLPNDWISLKNGTDCDDNNNTVPQFLCDDRPELCGFVENGCPAPGTYCGPCPDQTDAGSDSENEDAGWSGGGMQADVDAGEPHIEDPELNVDAGVQEQMIDETTRDQNDKENGSAATPSKEGGCLGQQMPSGTLFPVWLWMALLMAWTMKKKRGPQG